MKIAFALSSLILSSVAFAGGSTMSVGGSAKHTTEGENKFSVGASFGLPITKGIGYWTWNGYGGSDQDNKWISSQHGVDFTLNALKVGPMIEYKLEDEESVFEFGARASVKLW